MLPFGSHQWKAFNRLRRKHKVSLEFLQYNLRNILKLITYGLQLRIVLKSYAVRKRHSVVIKYNQPTRYTFDDDLMLATQRKQAKRRLRILKQWSKGMVQHLRKVIGVKEFEEVLPKRKTQAKDVINEMKKQLELLKAGKRSKQLIEDVAAESGEANKEAAAAKATVDANGNEQEFLLNEKTGFMEKNSAEAVFIDLDTSVEEEAEPTPQTQHIKAAATDCVSKEKTVCVEPNLNLNKNGENAQTQAALVDNFLAPKSPLKQKTETQQQQQKTQAAGLENKTKAVETAPKSTNSATNILDVLMQKVFAPRVSETESEQESVGEAPSSSPTKKDVPLESASVASPAKKNISHDDSVMETDPDAESSEEFLGFAEDERLPGMMRTPLVRYGCEQNSAFISRTLDEYFRDNALDTSVDVAQLTKLSINRKVRQTNIDGLMTPNCQAPPLAMPALPESLLKLRTVAERRHFLQKCSRSSKLTIINNEASIYRELQRKIRHPRMRWATQQALQTANHAQIAYTRQGWQAASFINTDLNKYYYQKMHIKEATKAPQECVTLRGVLGNNNDKFKPTYTSRPAPAHKSKCTPHCVDCYIAPSLKPLETFASKKKLYNRPLRPLFKACPLSQKPRNQLLDKDAAQTVDMAVARLPAVELAVSPELGKSFNDIAKRYLQFITPYSNISREWAEFSVSTLQLPKRVKKAEKPMQRKTYVFNIPYANDRSQILVRRIVHREEMLDAFFRSSEELPSWSGLSFRDKVDVADEVAVACADVLTDMLNSVAISCCEDSFMLQDNETAEVLLSKQKAENAAAKCKSKAPIKAPISQKISPVHNKNARLFNELRRLNATIIDTQSQTKEEQYQCKEEFCALGCICGSLANGKGSSQHCGKLKCMFRCKCNGTNASQIVRLESDGRTITAEDAVMMRRQATARLARMEKEFTSTIVVTENETLLINDSAYEKRRRAARVPKRYEDYRHGDDEFLKSPVKSSGGGLNDSTEFRSPSTVFSERSYEREQEPVVVEDVVLQKLKHCSVPVVPFDEIQNMSVFCLVHQLYKCFCGGRATEGKRVIIEKENLGTSKTEKAELTLRSPKSRYSFEKIEEVFPSSSSTASAATTPKSTAGSVEERSNELAMPQTPKSHKLQSATEERSLLKRSKTKLKNICRNASESGSDLAISPAKIPKMSPPAAQQQDILAAYALKVKQHGCSRFVPVPSRTYRSRNRKQVSNVYRYIRASEDRASQLLLNEHIMRSVYYHKEMVKAEKAKLAQLSQQLQFMPNPVDVYATLALKRRPTELPVPMPMAKQPKVEIEPANEEEDSMDITSEESQQSTQPATLLSQRYTLAENIAMPEESSSSSLPDDTASSAKDDENVMRENFNEVIKTLNGLVSRKMHDIDNALKRDSKQVPAPTEDILCVLRWRNFAEAYREHYIYVWEVKMKNRHFLAATITNIIPIVPGALGVMNILAVPTERLPLIGRMLMLPFSYNESVSLAVIMQGRSQYWYIKGFLEPNGAKACLRPTPETHPELSLKINTLCSSLVKQRAREQERLSILQKQRREKQQMQQQQHQQQQQQQQAQKITPHPPAAAAATQTAEYKIKQFHLQSLKNCTLKTTNIAMRRVMASEIANIKPPQIVRGDHRWYVLDFVADFSHVFMPELKELISFEHITRLQEMTHYKKTVHRMEFHEKNNFAAYFVPDSKQKIYFGPLSKEQPAPILVLMQKVNGEMMPREVFEKMRLLKPQIQHSTTAFWITQMNGKRYFHEANTFGFNKNTAATATPTMGATTATTATATIATPQTKQQNDDDDEEEDDCFIVEAAQQANKQFTAAAAANASATQNANKTLMNFTIQTSAETNALKISTADGFELTHTDAATAATQANNDKETESQLKILSVFNLPPVSSSSSSGGGGNTKQQTQATVDLKRHSLQLPDTTNGKLQAAQNSSLNKSLSAVNQATTSAFQQEFSKAVAGKANTKSTKAKLQVVRPLKPMPTATAPKLGTIITSNAVPNTQQLGGFKLVLTPAATLNAKPITTTIATTATVTPSSSNNSSISSTATINTQATTTQPLPVNIMKTVPIAKFTANNNNTPTTTTTPSTSNTISIQNLQRPITIRRVDNNEANNNANITTTLNSVTAPVKRLSSGIIKLPTGIIRAVRPVNATTYKQQTPINLPPGIKIARTTLSAASTTTTPTQAQTTPTVFPVNLLVAPQQQPQQPQQPDITTITLAPTTLADTPQSTMYTTKPIMQSSTGCANLRFIQPRALNTQPAGITNVITMPKISKVASAATTQSPTPAKIEISATKVTTNAPSFLAKKTAAPSSVVRTNQSWPQKKFLHKGELIEFLRTPTPPQHKTQQIATQQQQQISRPKLPQKPNQKPQNPPARVSLPESSANADVILIDD